MTVFGFDVDEKKAQNLKNWVTCFKHFDSEIMKTFSKFVSTYATFNFTRLIQANIFLLYFSTSFNHHRVSRI